MEFDFMSAYMENMRIGGSNGMETFEKRNENLI